MSKWDKDLHDQQVSDLFQAGSVEQPSEELDRRVRHAARTQLRRPGHRVLWRSLGTAAVIVLAIGLIRVQQEQGVMEEPLMAPQESDFAGKPSAPVEREERKARARVEMQVMGLSRQKSMESRAGQQVEKAAVAEMADSMAPAAAKKETGCSWITLPEGDRAAWLAIYREMISMGQLEQAECLSRIFRERFGELPGVGE